MFHHARRWMTSGLFLVLIAFLLIAVTVVAALGQRHPAKTRRRTDVAELFRNNCARCHGADGRAQTPTGQLYKTPNFTDGEWWRKNANITHTRTLVGIVTRGRGGMPAFGKKLKRSEITALVNYARRFRPQE